MAYEIASLYPEIGRSALALPLFAAAIMELAGPALCRLALRKSGEADPQRQANDAQQFGVGMRDQVQCQRQAFRQRVHVASVFISDEYGAMQFIA